MIDAWWCAIIPCDTLGFPYYSLRYWCLVDDLPRFRDFPHEDPNEHIKVFVEYCLLKGIFDPPLTVCILSLTI